MPEQVNAVIGVIPMRYADDCDQLIPVTQEWVNEAQKTLGSLRVVLWQIQESVDRANKIVKGNKAV
jgi:hypothetical protein